MLEQVKYYNHLGESISFGSASGYYLNYNDLRDYEWGYDTEHGKVVNFRRGVTKKAVPILIKGGTVAASLMLKNALYATFEKDIIAGVPGYFQIGDYKMECYVYASKKSDYLIDKTAVRINASIVSETGAWVKSNLHTYVYDNSYPSSEEPAKDYEYDYEYDYMSAYSTGYNAEINNAHFAPVDWIMQISAGGTQGAIEIIIGTDLHKLNYTIPANGVVEINSKLKTIVSISPTGTRTNRFNLRDKTTDIFAKIGPGVSPVSWNGAYNFTLTLLLERSEPVWI